MKEKIKGFVKPNNNAMITIAEDWWEVHKGINFKDWSPELVKHSYPFRIANISSDLINLGHKELNNPEVLPDLISQYSDIINPLLNEMNCKDSFFIKLITRSPKDYLSNPDNHGKPVDLNSVADAVVALISSMRCIEDMCLLRYLKQSAIVIRPYINFHPSNEWRVFIKNKQIIGISQYYWTSWFPEFTIPVVSKINTSIRLFTNDVVIPNMELSDYITDVVIENDGSNPIILETNPYGLSDTCLFEDYKALDGSIIWNIENNKIHKI